MIKDSEIARINELAAIKKQRELTPEEAAEQKMLREKFLANFRAGFKQKLEQIEIVSPDDPRLKKNNYSRLN